MNRFDNFTDNEIVALFAVLERVGGSYDGTRGTTAVMFDEVAAQLFRRQLAELKSTEHHANGVVTGSLYFED